MFVTGATGLLGFSLVEELVARGYKVYATHHRAGPLGMGDVSWIYVDLGDPDTIIAAVREASPDVVVHAAAYTDVDGCELNKEQAYRINYEATRAVAAAAQREGSGLIYISTDYVFDGLRGMYREGDVPNPVNYYGLTKLLGEVAVASSLPNRSLIVRVSGLYGYSPTGKKNFGMAALERLMKGEPVNAFHDQYLSPTYTYHLAKSIAKAIEKGLTGLVHVAGDRASRYEFALMLAEALGADRSLVNAVSLESARLPARRPRDSSLDTALARSHGLELPPLQECVRHFVESYKRRAGG
ncbi:MAG: dTDP-4-dehydrorhamnose reductase [Desulfurococcaceae archaeon]